MQPALIVPFALLLAWALDFAFGEPRDAWHPVAWLGRLLEPLGRALCQWPALPALAGGATAWLLIAGVLGGLAHLVQNQLLALAASGRAPWGLLSTGTALALLLKPCFAWCMLRQEVQQVERALAQGLPQGRAQVARLVSRNVSNMDAHEVRETAIETLAENLNDSVVAPLFWFAVAAADPTRYPDPGYHLLREQLAAWHGVAPERIVFAASASEFIQRITAVGARLMPGQVALPIRAYGDCAATAQAWGRTCTTESESVATLRWCADPSSPLGQHTVPPTHPGAVPTVLDAAYAPLRLHACTTWTALASDQVFCLYSPNKALGLPGVRGAYAVAPKQADWPVSSWCDALAQAQASWPLGAHAVALLQSWSEPATQKWLAASRQTLSQWTAALRSGLAELDLQPQDSVTSFLCAHRPAAASAAMLHARGLAVRDAASFGMPGWMRVSAQPPDALEALLHALREALASVAPRVGTRP